MATSRQTPHVSLAFVSLWRSLRRDLFADYRPERHYMRGPGPAWRAKHAGPSSQPALPGLADARV
jgi:hypothetical protein